MSVSSLELRPLPTGAVKSWLAARKEAEASPEQRRVDESLWRLREAGAVLTGFDPAKLQPLPGSGPFDEKARLNFLADTVPVEGAPPQFGWRLAAGVRRLALERLKTSSLQDTRAQLLAALAANPERPKDAAQRLLEAAIAGTLPAPQELSRNQLLALSAVLEWLEGIVEGVPNPAIVARLIARADLLDPMHRLAGPEFVGRDEELRRLSDHVDVLAIDRSAGVLGSIAQQARRVLNVVEESLSGARRPLFIYGPGGVGKSSLLARFILLHASVASKTALPFVILDVDRPGIEPLHPLTFLVDALGQLQHQLEGLQGPTRELSGKILERLGARETADLESVIDDTGSLITEFARLTNPQIANRPLLFVIDTFEEVQFLGSDAVGLVLDFLSRLQREMPGLRVVVSGRLPPDRTGFYKLPLGELPPQAAKNLLVRVLREGGVTPPRAEQLDEIIESLGGNPMVVCLAARLIAEGDFEGVHKAGRQREWLRKVRVEAIQARLYGRILLHIHDRKVRKLAFPGLLVRRLNAELIPDVLAGPCDIDVADAAEARKLIDLMAREIALVSRDPQDGNLVYRPDIRRIMLESDTTVSKDTVLAIDEGAIRFWNARNGPVARAEELYHRMRLDQPGKTLEERWDASAAPLLRSALGELPDGAQHWLAKKLGVTVSTDSRAYALQTDWEDYAALTSRRLLEGGKSAEALRILRERSERLEGSPLRALEVRALYTLDRLDEAFEVASHGVDASAASGDAPGEVELRLLCALVLERTSRFAEALAEAQAAAEVAEQAGLQESLLRALVRVLRLERLMDATNSPEHERNRARAHALLGAIGVVRVQADAGLLRDTAAELGDGEPELLHAAVDRLGVEVLRTTPRDRLREVLERIGSLAPDIVASVIGGNLWEIAKIATSVIMSGLGAPTAGIASTLVIELFREAAERAVSRSSKSDKKLMDPNRSAAANLRAAQSSPETVEMVADLIVQNFTRSAFRRMLITHLSRELEDHTSSSKLYEIQVVEVVRAARKDGWLADLLDAIYRSKPDDKDLQRALERVMR
jgi:hypothetical protein